MLRNYLAAALRNLARNRVYTIISVACLSVGLAATFLAAAYIDHLHSYNRWIDGYQHVYRVAMEYTLPGKAPVPMENVPYEVAPWMAANVSHVLDATRIVMARAALRRGDFEAVEPVAWADGNVFRVLPMPTYLGDLTTALQQPDSIVLTRSLARKYFGTDRALGEVLELNREHPMTVRAIIEDLPPNTQLVDQDVNLLVDSDLGVFVAAGAAFSPISAPPRQNAWNAYTYIRVDAQATPAQLDAQLAPYPDVGTVKLHLYTKPLDQVVYSRDRHEFLFAMPLLAVLALLISGMNFVNLTTARAIRRSIEVGVRKAAGASRGHLIAQFMGETLIFSAIGMAIALSLCELSMPIVRNLLDVPITFEYWRSPPLMLTIGSITVVTALLSGFYPAALLAGAKPASILNGGKSQTGQTRGLRQALVMVQFAVLAALVIGVIVAQKQLDHLLQKSLRFDDDQMLMIASSCRQAFVDELRKIVGVAGVACSASAPLNLSITSSVLTGIDGTRHSFEVERIDGHWLDLYGLQPLAGRFFRADAPEDVIPHEPGRPWRIIINATAAREFGFESPQAAVGKNPFSNPDVSFEVVGVIKDFRLGRFDQPMAATLYLIEPDRDNMLSVKLRGEHIPETLQRIDELWKELGDPKPISRFFLSETIEQMHRSIVRQRSIFAAFAVLAISLAIVGMLGLASSTAEERRLEIGVRKAFGASVRDVVRLVLWRFIKLAALAALLGCCLAVPLMNHWLEGFVDRIDLQAWMFLGTCVLIVSVAVLTVCGHALIMSRSRPSDALR
jgi:putative ABC transport system permease protein